MNGLDKSWMPSRKFDILRPPRVELEQTTKASLVSAYESLESPTNLMFKKMERLISRFTWQTTTLLNQIVHLEKIQNKFPPRKFNNGP